jgi:hypothetical protein
MPEEYKLGDKVPKSRIYKVVHDFVHDEELRLRRSSASPSRLVKECGRHPRFTRIRAPHHIKTHKHFKK